ncbi:MAG: type secretion protein [Candidatus Solibacter sp.]|nr:type secretion protein [Candidatus Solibacter sp.]
MPPAARITDMHTCPMVTGIVPHVGGPILPPGCPTVLIGMLPAARVGDMAVCVGPPDVIAKGSPTVLIGNMMAARMGDLTAHGGVIVIGCPTVIIGEVGMGGVGRAQAGTMQAAKLAGAAFTKANCDVKALGPVNTEWLGTGGAFGSQAAAMRDAKQRAAHFVKPECDKAAE